MKLKIEAHPYYMNPKEQVEIRLEYTDNLNDTKQMIVEILDLKFDPEIRRRIIDKMFYELKRKALDFKLP